MQPLCFFDQSKMRGGASQTVSGIAQHVVTVHTQNLTFLDHGTGADDAVLDRAVVADHYVGHDDAFDNARREAYLDAITDDRAYQLHLLLTPHLNPHGAILFK